MARALVGVAGALILLPALAAGGLAWRLAQGPLDVTAAARAAAAWALPGLEVGSVSLALQGDALLASATALRFGRDGASAGSATATLAAAKLLQGALRVREVAADGLVVHVDRAADGALSLRGLPAPSPAPEPVPGPTAGPLGGAFAQLTRLTVHGAALSVTDAATQQVVELSGLTADLRRDGAGVVDGEAHATLASGGAASAVDLAVSAGPGGQGSRVSATIAAVNPAALARLNPALAPLSALDATLSLTADLLLTPAFGLRHGTVHAQAGRGHMALPAKGGGTSPAAFASLALDAEGDPAAVSLVGLRLVLEAPSGAPTTLLLSGDAVREASRVVGHLHAAIDRVQFAELGSVWPPGVGGGSRAWLVENVVAGTAHDGSFDLTLEAATDLSGLALTEAGGTLQADDLSLFWLRPVPPLALPHATLTLLDADTLSIAAPIGHQGPLTGRQVAMRVWGLSTKDQFSQIDGDIAGAVADVIALLKQPRLKLLSAHPLPFSTVAGQSATHLTVKLPLEAKVDMDAVGIRAAMTISDLRVVNVVAGRSLDQGAFSGTATQDGLAVSGTARLAGVPSSIAVDMDFRSGPPTQVVQHATVAGRGDERSLAAAGLDTGGMLGGTFAATVEYAEERNGHAWLQAAADLGEASVSTPLGWSKPAGPPASVAARAELNHGQLAGFDQLHAEGPGLSVQGRSEIVDGWPSVLHLERGVIGRTNVSGTISFPIRPGEPISAVLSGPLLDLSGPFGSKPDAGRTPPPPPVAAAKPPQPFKLDVRLERLLVGGGSGIGPISLLASGDTHRVAQARLLASGPEQVDLRLEPNGQTRRLTASVGDVGRLLHGLDAGSDVDQGVLSLTGEFDDRLSASPLTGTASLTRFGVHGATTLGKLLQAMTLYGLLDALRGPGLVFDQATLPFTLTGRVLDLRGARAFSASLGVTAEGGIDLARHTLDLKGTIVPAYFFNTLLGRLPLLGALFSPEPGGGLFAATYAVHGAIADPSVSVNPLATLTPGALRGLFGLFD